MIDVVTHSPARGRDTCQMPSAPSLTSLPGVTNVVVKRLSNTYCGLPDSGQKTKSDVGFPTSDFLWCEKPFQIVANPTKMGTKSDV